MHTLTKDEFHLEAEPFLRKIFVNDNPFNEPFSSQVIGRTIIYPCEDENDLLIIQALINAAVNLGDTGCYISLISIGCPEYGPAHCYIPLSEFLEGYAGTEEDQLIGPRLDINPYELDSVIYSSQGKWGLMRSHERFGLLGGPPEFIEEIRGSVPDLDKQVYGFFERLRLLLVDCDVNPPDITRNKWLPTLLTHVYGAEVAEKLLEEETRLLERM